MSEETSPIEFITMLKERLGAVTVNQLIEDRIEISAVNQDGSDFTCVFNLDEENLVGVGDTSLIFSGYITQTDTHVAIKIFAPKDRNKSDSPSKEDFIREAIHLSTFDHPNIARFYSLASISIGTKSEVPVIIRELFPTPLEHNSQQIDKMSFDEGIILISDISFALGYLSEKGIFITDLTPSNIFKRENGQYVIGDINLAVDRESKQIVGYSELFSAPEIISIGNNLEEDISKVTMESEIFSLALILNTCLSGTYPEQYSRALGGPLISEFSEYSFKNNLREILNKATSVNPVDRYHSFEEFINEIKKLQ